jgi:hypothetical protein
LNEALAHFYINLRHSLSRYLQAPPFLKTFDLVKGEDFRDANLKIRAVLAELKREGKGSVDPQESEVPSIIRYRGTSKIAGQL